MDRILPDINQDTPERSRKRRSTALDEIIKKTKGDNIDVVSEEENNEEFMVEEIIDYKWDERQLCFFVKWKFYSEEDNSWEKLPSFLSLHSPFDFMTRKNVNEESDVFSIFTGLHKSGYRCHVADDRFYFCRLKKELLCAPFSFHYLSIFNDDDERELRLREFNTKLQRIDGEFQFKIINESDRAVPPPFFGVTADLDENDPIDQPPRLDSRERMTIARTSAAWCLRTDEGLDDGRRLFQFEGTMVPAWVASNHVKKWGELIGIAHFVRIGRDEDGMEWTLDRREVFDAAAAIGHSCNPNCKVVVNVKEGRVEVVTRRKIEKGEDITLDYYGDERIETDGIRENIMMGRDCIECMCLNDNCRKVLWQEIQWDESFYQWNKEEKLRMQANRFKGVQFNTD